MSLATLTLKLGSSSSMQDLWLTKASAAPTTVGIALISAEVG